MVPSTLQLYSLTGTIATPGAIRMGFGKLLRELREQAGLSQNALARAAGIDPTHLNRIEAGKQGPPRKPTTIKLLRGLGLPLTDERAQALLLHSEARARLGVSGTAVLASPLGSRRRRLRPVLRDLRTTLLRAVELIAELEDITAELDEKER